MHSEICHYRKNSMALSKFLRKVSDLLPTDKYESFNTLMAFPLSTVSLTGRIYTALQKIFDGRNPFYNAEFTSERDKADWLDYRNNTLNLPTFWKTEGFERMKTAINSIVIIDLPEVQTTEKPEPYLSFLNLSKVIDLETDGNRIEWILFEHSEGKTALFDSFAYRIIDREKGIVISEIAHGLGETPAKFFWTTSISSSEQNTKVSPLSKVLGHLDNLLFYEVSNEHLNTYARYPVYWAFAEDCDYSEESGNYCQSGFLKTQNGLNLLENGSAKQCPVCSKNRLDGAGSFIEVDPPSEANDGNDLRNPLGVVTIDRTSLDYNNEDLNSRKEKIYNSVTGYEGSPVNNQAVNEKQVTATFESLESCLKLPQWNFEQIMKWADSLICKLRYDSTFKSVSISLGTEHYILNASQIMQMYVDAKNANFNNATLDILEDKYFETEYRYNPQMLQRQRILSNIDPFRHKDETVISKMFDKGLIKEEDYLLKINFSSLIMRFERENLPVTQFGAGVSFESKITKIQSVLREYAKELQPQRIDTNILNNGAT